jgi:peptidoglycan hydrolase-like protein with peptidoglycan-binding domain
MLQRDGVYTQNPTGRYDQATILAVQAFQRKYNLLTAGSPESNGYGLAGPQTRAKLNSLYASPIATLPSPEVQALIAELQRQLLVLLQELYRLMGAR